MSSNRSTILIIDFGSQSTQLIARRIREIGIYCEIYSFTTTESVVQQLKPCGVILSGGPETVTAKITPRAPAFIFNLGIPILGICYGMQTMAQQLGGTVIAAPQGEFGHTQLRVTEKVDLLSNIEDSINVQGEPLLNVWMSHTDKVIALPLGFIKIAQTTNSTIAAMANEQRHFYGVQFHPEVTQTQQGHRILERFAIDICRARKQWTTQHIVTQTLQNIREKVGQDTVVLGLSGGVDSSVAAALLQQAIGKQLICIFVDHGLLRLHEAQQVLQIFKQHLKLTVIHIDAKQQFFAALKNIKDPEEKRRIIGHEFIAIFEEEARKLPQAQWLAQGTIYPDVIESAADGHAKMIKTHHNVGGLPKTLQLKLIEPLRQLFKDEVRKVGLELGLPHEMIYRHPFPGPGLAVRILGTVTEQVADKLRLADHIFMEMLKAHQLYDQVSQAFAVFLPINSVGVIGDARQYAPIIALRAVETVDFMTARWARLPHDFLSAVADRIVNEVKGISRVVYDISGKPPATIEWE